MYFNSEKPPTISTDLASNKGGGGGQVIVPVHTVLQGTSLPDVATYGTHKIEFVDVSICNEPLDDGRVERLGEGLSRRLI